MYYPTQETFIELAKQGNTIPVYREVLGDMITPVMVYRNLGYEEYSFLLESVEEGTLGRYSFIGFDPVAIFRAYGEEIEIEGSKGRQVFYSKDPLASLEEFFSGYRPVTLPGLPPFYGGLVGYLSYDMVTFFEGIPRGRDELEVPDLLFIVASQIIIFDHLNNRVQVVAHAFFEDHPKKSYLEATEKIEGLIERFKGPGGDLPSGTPSKKGVTYESNFTKEEFSSRVERAKDYIKAGDIFQVVLSQRLKAPLKVHPFSLYRSLRLINPSPYMFYLNFKELKLVGSSPEILVRLEGDVVSVRPLAGTRKRGQDKEEDQIQAKDLLTDKKERAEHLMLVDLGRNDVGRVSQFGSVEVSKFMDIEYYSHVMHIVSAVKGRLEKGLSAFQVLRSAFPAGTVSGAPKIRAMEIISELEGVMRGPYAGAVGYFSFSGNMDTCITIRTFLIKDNWVYLQAGAGIVADSVPKEEYQETLNKAQALLQALYLAEENWGEPWR